jgi:hypothetical protein
MLLKALILLSALCYSISAHLILKPPATAAEGKNVLLVYVPGVLGIAFLSHRDIVLIS